MRAPRRRRRRTTCELSRTAIVWWNLRGRRPREDERWPWSAAGVSIIAADMSAISYVGAPAWAFQKDLRLATGLLLFPLFMLPVVYLFIPFMARLRLFTIYEYLERRFGLPSRLLASLMFILIVVGRLAVLIS